MIKSRNPLFNKTINKKDNLMTGSNNDEYNPTKTRRSFFRQSKNNSNLTNIIQNLQKNVKQLKTYYHQSLQRANTSKLQKSSSLSEMNKLRCNTKNKIKSYLPSTAKRRNNRQTISTNKQNRCINLKQDQQIIESTVSKYIPQNGSTMMSLLNADVDEVKKAYVQTYGKQNGNIVDLYNFFRKNTQKSTRIHGGSIEISSYAHGDQSEYLKKSRDCQLLQRKSNELLNVIVEDRHQKQPIIESQSKTLNEANSIYKMSAQKNPTIQEIFKGGCPDLANVYEFVKKRRVSLKNYMNMNKNNKDSNGDNNEKKNHNEKTLKSSTEPVHVTIQPQRFPQYIADPVKPTTLELFSQQAWSTHKKPFLLDQQQQLLSNKKYLPSKSSKKSQRSSIKKSRQKEINLDENIQPHHINIFTLLPQLQQPITNIYKQQEKGVDYQTIQSQQLGNQNDQKQMGLKYKKFKRSKYYVQPIPSRKQNSLDGCSISFKSSSRIIELDFIPLDL